MSPVVEVANLRIMDKRILYTNFKYKCLFDVKSSTIIKWKENCN